MYAQWKADLTRRPNIYSEIKYVPSNCSGMVGKAKEFVPTMVLKSLRLKEWWR